MNGKQRLSASVDADLIAAAERSAARGDVPTVSAWVNDAMRMKVEHDRRLDALAELVAEFETEHCEISKQEMADGTREVRRRASSTRGTRAGESRRKYTSK